MAALLGETPEEAPEVPEPDLSMELQDQLKRCLTEHEACCTKEQMKVQRLLLPHGRSRLEVDAIRDRYAEAAVIELVTTLKSFDPDISKDKLSGDIYRILHSDAVVGHLSMSFKGSLRMYVPRNRSEWLGEDVERHIACKRAFLRVLSQQLRRVAGDLVSRLPPATAPFDRTAVTRVALLSASGSSALLGFYCGTVGLLGGSAAGTMVGAIPAPLTLGLSLPVGAIVGGGLGVAAGTLMGGACGFVGGGATGAATYVYRADLQDGIVYVKGNAAATSTRLRTRAFETTGYLKVSAIDAVDVARGRVLELTQSASEAMSSAGVVTVSAAKGTQAKAAKLGADLLETAQDRKTQVTAAAAAGGAVVVGVGGSAVGFVSGGAIGAACGVLPALFTFGLSIPIGAAIGSGAGLCLGAAAGGTAGLVGGGTTGYSVYAHRGDIGSGLSRARCRADQFVSLVRSKASDVKTRLIGDKGGTD
eukprot:CAMPEP_0203967988 /NCGR_PEP_ID=MMETSP0359-20131031/96721_1 /ASSEMBLY_ACC=CAM_ASM_000338 /TAXON_ID=268821 /ORGANISM="Scrippsiella Hangoei, Strain SHTV-5" /LENGTH=474 /DNA_ID=CAMNT_0050905907 /DNA_START=49 /DNA_END=1473 /DNA_ORIENTATION=-